MVTVHGGNILEPPLLESNKVKTIVIRTSEGKPILLVVNIHDDTWGVSSSMDSDWKTVLERFGIQ